MARPEHQHLLLAPAQRARVLAAALRQPRKHGKDAIHAPADFCGVVADIETAELEIFADRQERKDVTTFRHQRNAELAALVRRHRRHVTAGKCDRARSRRQHTSDRAKRRGFSRTIGADQRNDLAAVKPQ